MKQETLSKVERKELKKLQRPSILLAAALFVVITALNFTIYNQDVLTGMESMGKPPISQLIIVQVIALILAGITFYFLSKKSIKDLMSGQKVVDEQTVIYKFIKNHEGKPAYTFQLGNKLTVFVDVAQYKSTKVGDPLTIEYAPASSHIFGVRKD